jgi:hypothetical protein
MPEDCSVVSGCVHWMGNSLYPWLEVCRIVIQGNFMWNIIYRSCRRRVFVGELLALSMIYHVNR